MEITAEGITSGDIDTQGVLDGARHLEGVVLVGFDKEGEIYYASSYGSEERIVYLLDKFKHGLLNGTSLA